MEKQGIVDERTPGIGSLSREDFKKAAEIPLKAQPAVKDAHASTVAADSVKEAFASRK